MVVGSKAKLVACTGTHRSTLGRSRTTQQRPSCAWDVIATSGRVRPHSGCRGSRTVMVCSGATLCPTGVVTWLGFSHAAAAQIDEVGLVFDKAEIEVVLHLETVHLGGPVPAKLIEGFDDWKACLANAILGGTVAPQVRLAFEESAQVVHM